MSYQVLARKWRPRRFDELVGQEPVVQALCNALDRDRLHHAYLFTGTRGVGKTTLARILAKSLNCEQGLSSRPCGVCSTCQEIDQGRFVDLLEVDAASRTKVEQTRELLENVPFAPAKGRYKVYLIDEVHMFSTSSFNALLKTLEEPPAHVKFVLATTDPQKVPATVLSRCLQFNLSRLLPERISGHLERVLTAEGIPFEAGAMHLLARAADGSMRDALSLLDQAIAFGGHQVLESEVRILLGTVVREMGFLLLGALARQDGRTLLAEIARMADQTPDFTLALNELLGLLHRLALWQQVPEALDSDPALRDALTPVAGLLSPEEVQLFYQIGLMGQRDLALAPDPRMGFEMVLLRMLAFRPVTAGGGQASPPAVSGRRPGSPLSNLALSQAAPPPAVTEPRVRPVTDHAVDWYPVAARLPAGLVSELAHHCTLVSWNDQCLHLCLDPQHEHLRNPATEAGLRQALGLAAAVALIIESRADPRIETPAKRRERETTARLQQAQQRFEADDFVKSAGELLAARILPQTIRPLDA
ncbi:MAG: DNA polymerase III subunit gamma/tau [Pseudomonadota bacterium]